MANRNHLHVCRHCGVVHATSSTTGPRKCMVCEDSNFSQYDPDGYLRKKMKLPSIYQLNRGKSARETDGIDEQSAD